MSKYRRSGYGKASWKAQVKSCMILVLLVAFSSCAIALYFSHETGVAAGEMRYFDEVVVSPGDTLWTLAGPHRPAGMDIRNYVDIVAEVNGVEDGIIQPGQRLVLPR